MMLIVTGTPGCGKTTVTEIIEKKIECILISINSLLENYDLNMGIDKERGYKIVDTTRMIPIVDKIKKDNENKTILFEGHLAQDYPNADKVVVLRCNPEILEERLSTRNWTDKKIRENISAEILGICTQESFETYGYKVQEIDTTNSTPEEIADMIINIIEDKKEYPLGKVDYLDKYLYLLN